MEQANIENIDKAIKRIDKGINQIINAYILCLQKENLRFKRVYLFGSKSY